MGKTQKYAIANLAMAMVSGIMLVWFILFLFICSQQNRDAETILSSPLIWLLGPLIGIGAGCLIGKNAEDESGYRLEFSIEVTVYIVSLIVILVRLVFSLIDNLLVELALMLQIAMFISFSIRGLRLVFVIPEKNRRLLPKQVN